MLWNAFRLALREIQRNALRSFLTVLGIVIGVSAVITMVTIGSGATARISEDISRLGSNLLILRPGQFGGPGRSGAPAKPFEAEDAEAIRREIYSLEAVAPMASRSLTTVLGNESWSTTVTGTTNEYFQALDWTIESGRIFTDSELRSGASVCLIGATVREELFGNQNPLGSRIRLEKLSCDIVGLLDTKGQGSIGPDQDDTVIIPLRTFHRRIAGDQDVQSIAISVSQRGSTEKAQHDLERLMRERRLIQAGEDDDFSVLDMKQIAETLTGTTQVLTALLGAVAAVSLLVGGIGIMNIMLVSVTERTREIGIRLAIGALAREVLLQFLVEAVVLSSMGGLIGVALAVTASFFLAQLLQVPLVLNPGIMILAFLFSAVVGIVFGFFPARKAAKMNPIDALRHE